MVDATAASIVDRLLIVLTAEKAFAENVLDSEQ